MAISVQNEQEAKVLAQALKNGRVPSAQREEALAALRSYNDQYHANRQAATEGGFGQQVARKAAIAGEGIAVGVGDVVDMIASPFTGAAYLAEKALGTLEPGEKFFGEDSYGDISSAIDRSIEGPEPVTQFERSLSGFARVVGGAAGGGIGLGRSLAMAGGRSIAARGAQRLGSFLADQPKTQLLAASLGEGARQLAEGTGQSGGVQLAASLVGALSPAAAQAVMRKVFVGGAKSQKALSEALEGSDELSRVVNQLEDDSDLALALVDAGLIDQVKGTININAIKPGGVLDGILRSTPGAARRLAKQADEAERRIGAVLRSIGGITGFKSGRIGEGTIFIDPQTAGRAAEKAVDTARANFRKSSSALYNQLDRQVDAAQNASGQNLLVPVTKLLDEFNTVAPDTGIAVGQAHPLLSTLRKNILATAQDVNGQKVLPYEDFMQMRKMLGGKMNNHNFFTDPQTTDLKRLFRAASDDFEGVAKQWDDNFGTQILRANDKARSHYREGRELFDDTLAFITRKVDRDGVAVEDVFQSIVTNSKNAPSRIVALMDSIEGAPRSYKDIVNAKQLKENRVLSPAEKKVAAVDAAEQLAATESALHAVRAGIIENLAKPLDSSDKAFSVGTFLTNWRRLRPASREAIFKGDPDTMKAIDRLAKLAERQVASNRAGARVSDVTTALSQLGIAGGVGVAAGGPLAAVATIIGGTVGANGFARLMTNKHFARWLAESAGRSRNIGASLTGLSAVAEKNPEIADDLNKIVRAFGVLAYIDDGEEEKDERRRRLLGD